MNDSGGNSIKTTDDHCDTTEEHRENQNYGRVFFII